MGINEEEEKDKRQKKKGVRISPPVVLLKRSITIPCPRRENTALCQSACAVVCSCKFFSVLKCKKNPCSFLLARIIDHRSSEKEEVQFDSDCRVQARNEISRIPPEPNRRDCRGLHIFCHVSLLTRGNTKKSLPEKRDQAQLYVHIISCT